MNRDQITLLVKVDLDPVPGEFATRESWKRQLQRVLDEMVGHYHPQVEVGSPRIEGTALETLEQRLLAMEGYTPAVANAVVENYPVEIAEANDFHDLIAFTPMTEETITELDKEAWHI